MREMKRDRAGREMKAVPRPTSNALHAPLPLLRPCAAREELSVPFAGGVGSAADVTAFASSGATASVATACDTSGMRTKCFQSSRREDFEYEYFEYLDPAFRNVPGAVLVVFFHRRLPGPPSRARVSHCAFVVNLGTGHAKRRAPGNVVGVKELVEMIHDVIHAHEV